MLYRNFLDFITAYSHNMKIMCIDFGEKKIGISLSDNTNIIAIPHSTYQRRNKRQDIGTIVKILKENYVHSLVIGLPLELNGEENDLCKKIITFANQIIKKHPVRVYLHDERYTSAMATSITKIAELKRKKAQKVNDTIAATIMLQEIINRIKRETDQSSKS